MDHPFGSPTTPTSDLNGPSTALCTPRPARKRSTSHVATPDLSHQDKMSKIERQTARTGTSNIEHDEMTLSRRPQLSAPALAGSLDRQSLECAGSSLLPRQEPIVLVAKYEEELHDLRAQLADLKAEMRDVEAQLPIKDKQLQNLKEFIAVQHLQPATVQGPDDSAVTSKFSALRYAITNLTVLELNGHPFFKPTKTDHKNFFARLTATEEDYKDYLGDSDGFKAFFFEGVIWTKLIDRLLCSPLSAFLDIKEGLIRDQVYVHAGASPQKFHAWRAYTADFLEDAFGPRTLWSPTSSLRSQLVAELVDLLSRYSTSAAGNVAALTNQVDDVVDKAVNLVWVMAKSRAYWVCSFPTSPETKLPYNFVYPQDLVKVEKYLEGGRRNIVDLVGRPALTKYGDSDGEQYHTHIVVEKAAALVFEGKKPKNADASYREV